MDFKIYTLDNFDFKFILGLNEFIKANFQDYINFKFIISDNFDFTSLFFFNQIPVTPNVKNLKIRG